MLIIKKFQWKKRKLKLILVMVELQTGIKLFCASYNKGQDNDV